MSPHAYQGPGQGYMAPGGVMNQMHPQIHQMPGMQLMSRLSNPPQGGHGSMVGPRPGYPVSSNNKMEMTNPASVQHPPSIEPTASKIPQTLASVDSSSNVSILSELSVPAAVPQQPAVPMPGTIKPKVSSPPSVTTDTLNELD